MGIKPNRYRIHQIRAWNIADQVFAEPSPRLQRLYGNPQDKIMKKADGRSCEVLFLRSFDVSAIEDNLEFKVAEREHDSSLGFLPMQLDNVSSYRVYVYRITILPD
jgi:hypothetical protein